MTAEPEFDFTGIHLPFPPIDGFTAEDLDRIPDLPRHTEFIDGSLVFASPQRIFHSVAIKLINRALDRHMPDGYLTLPEMTVTLAPRRRPEPDLVVVKAGAVTNRADAGIEHCWRVEDVDERVVVYVYRLDPATKEYVATGIYEKHLSLEAPFPIEIDLAEIDRFWS